MKVFCEDCKYVDGDPQSYVWCNHPISNYFSPKAPCQEHCKDKNKNNDCQDFMKLKEDQKTA